MTRFLLTINLLLTALFLDAQIPKGAKLLGGQVAYSNSSQQIGTAESDISRSVNFGISLGKAFKTNRVTGFNLNYGHSKFEYNNVQANLQSSTVRSIAPGIFTRRYKTLVKDLNFFGEGQLSMLFAKQNFVYRTSTVNSRNTQTGGSISLSAGVAYNIYRRLQVELTIPGIVNAAHTVSKTRSDNPAITETTTKTTNISSSIQNTANLGFLGVGFRFVL